MKKFPTWIHSIKFLCFDVDGTLYRDVPAIWNAIQSDLYADIMEQKHWDKKRTEEEFQNAYKKLGSSTKVLEYFGMDGQKFFTSVFKDFDFSKYIFPDQSLLQLFKRLEKQYRVGLLSNGNRESVVKKLQAVGLVATLFNPFLTTYEFGALKPDPAPFLKVIEDARVKPDESVYIGDKEETDILGAKGVGMHTIFVWGKSEEADLSIETIYDLENLFL